MTVVAPILKNMTCLPLSLVSFFIIRFFHTGSGFGKQCDSP